MATSSAKTSTLSTATADRATNEYWLTLDRKHRIQSRFVYPVCLTRGEGAWVWDASDKKYLDMESGQICASLGHSHPRYVEEVAAQLGKLVQTGNFYISDAEVRFQEKLATTTRGRLPYSWLACAGSESNEGALRLAKAATQRSEVVSFVGNYHGKTYGSWSISGFGSNNRAPFGPPMPGVSFLPTPFDYEVPDGGRYAYRDSATVDACIEHCNRLLDETTTGQPAAIFVELIQSAGGVRPLPQTFVEAIRRICDERSALMVVDEAQTGMGRLGAWWGHELWNVQPDIVTASKTLAGGVPMSAMLVSADLAEEAVARGYHQDSSHQGDPLLCAAGTATIDIIEEEDLLSNVTKVGAFLKAELQKLADESPVGGEVRGEGFLFGLELVKSKEGGEPNTEATEMFTNECRELGMLVGWGPEFLSPNVVRFAPPYILSMDEAEHALSVAESALKKTGGTGAR